MIESIILAIILAIVAGIAAILKKGINEILKGLESIDDRLRKIEESQNMSNQS